MSRPAYLLAGLALALYAVAAYFVVADVERDNGSVCGSAWRSARDELEVLGDQTDTDAPVVRARAECRAAGRRALATARNTALVATGLGVAAGAVAVGGWCRWRRQDRRLASSAPAPTGVDDTN